VRGRLARKENRKEYPKVGAPLLRTLAQAKRKKGKAVPCWHGESQEVGEAGPSQRGHESLSARTIEKGWAMVNHGGLSMRPKGVKIHFRKRQGRGNYFLRDTGERKRPAGKIFERGLEVNN